MRIAASARRHGITDEDMLHALRHYLRVFPAQGDAEATIFIGPAHDGTVLEVGFVGDEDDPRIIHAMPARGRYWP